MRCLVCDHETVQPNRRNAEFSHLVEGPKGRALARIVLEGLPKTDPQNGVECFCSSHAAEALAAVAKHLYRLKGPRLVRCFQNANPKLTPNEARPLFAEKLQELGVPDAERSELVTYFDEHLQGQAEPEPEPQAESELDPQPEPAQ